MDPGLMMVYTIAQPVLNLFFGFLWGLLTNRWVAPRRAFLLWAMLMVFVSVRVVGDWLFQQPHLPFETLRLYAYASLFFGGMMLARWLIGVYYPAEQ